MTRDWGQKNTKAIVHVYQTTYDTSLCLQGGSRAKIYDVFSPGTKAYGDKALGFQALWEHMEALPHSGEGATGFPKWVLEQDE